MEEVTVIHSRYGAGTVISRSEKVIRIRFAADGTERSFVYPDAFMKFLRYADPSRQEEVDAVLDERRRRAEEEAEMAAQRRSESLEAARLERLRLAAEKKRAVSRSRRTAKS